MSPEREPQACKSKAVGTTHDYLCYGVVPQPHPRAGNNERPWNGYECHQGTEQRACWQRLMQR
jgi:hypothetical protein